MDFGDDLFGGLGPHERFWVVVPVFGPHLQRLDEFVDAGEAAAAETLVSELFEPSLDQVQPRRRGRDEVQMMGAQKEQGGQEQGWRTYGSGLGVPSSRADRTGW